MLTTRICNPDYVGAGDLSLQKGVTYETNHALPAYVLDWSNLRTGLAS
jgi:hypothetical protein